MQKLDGFFLIHKNLVFKRARFNRRYQHERESAEEYSSLRLDKETAHCWSINQQMQHWHLRRRQRSFDSVKQSKSISSSCLMGTRLISCRQASTWRNSLTRDKEKHLTGRQHSGHHNKHLQWISAIQASVCVWERSTSETAVCFNCK